MKKVESGQLSAGKGNAGGGELGLIPWPKVDFAKFGEIEEKKLSRIQKLQVLTYTVTGCKSRMLHSLTKRISQALKHSVKSKTRLLRRKSWC